MINADNVLLTEEEHAELTSAFKAFTCSGTVPHQFHSDEMYHFFEEFTLALTFSSAVDCGEVGSKKRATLTLLSGWWHGFQTFQTQTQVELLGAILSATVGGLEEESSISSEVGSEGILALA